MIAVLSASKRLPCAAVIALSSVRTHIHISNAHTVMHVHACRHTHTHTYSYSPNDLIGVNCIMTVVNWSWVRGDTGFSGEGEWRKDVEKK